MAQLGVWDQQRRHSKTGKGRKGTGRSRQGRGEKGTVGKGWERQGRGGRGRTGQYSIELGRKEGKVGRVKGEVQRAEQSRAGEKRAGKDNKRKSREEKEKARQGEARKGRREKARVGKNRAGASVAVFVPASQSFLEADRRPHASPAAAVIKINMEQTDKK